MIVNALSVNLGHMTTLIRALIFKSARGFWILVESVLLPSGFLAYMDRSIGCLNLLSSEGRDPATMSLEVVVGDGGGGISS